MLNIYEIAKRQMNPGEIDHHYGDLYLKVTPVSSKLVEEYDYKNQVTRFESQIDHLLWYDIPFAYLDQWIKDEAEERKRFAEWVMERNKKSEPKKKNKYKVKLVEKWVSQETAEIEADDEEEAKQIAYDNHFDRLKYSASAVDDYMEVELIE